MAVVERDALIQRITSVLSDPESDGSLSLIEDLTDTLEAGSSDDWKTKYEENDAAWRKRYKERFLKKPDNEPEIKDGEKEEKKTYDDLFKVKED
nr:MAG TPA: hypothetical protein [Caudoviricetes sp.]